MRRIAVLAVFVTVVACLCAPPVEARGLYKGHGRISKHPLYNPFTVRLNGSLGWHGAFRAKDVEYFNRPGSPGSLIYSVSDWQFGNYFNGGLEFNLGSGASFEVYGLYRVIEDGDYYRIIEPDRRPLAPGPSSTLYRNIESKVYAAGANLRFYTNWNGGAAFLGLGGGYAHGEAIWESADELQTQGSSQQDSGDFHLMTGLDLHLAFLSLGFELGWRWSGLEDFNEFEGAFLGARAGIMFGDGG